MTHRMMAEARSLVKKYDSEHVIGGIHLQLLEGEATGILGKKGSGKSTIIQMMAGLCAPTAGDIFVLDLHIKKNWQEIKKQIALITAREDLEKEFSVYENVYFFARIHGLNDLEVRTRWRDLQRYFELDEIKDKKIYDLTWFEKIRTKWARALLYDPAILLMDDPTYNLYPAELKQVEKYIQDFLAKKKTCLIASSSHDFIEKTCASTLILSKGKVLESGGCVELIQKYAGKETVEFSGSKSDIDYVLNKFTSRPQMIMDENHVRLFVYQGSDGKQFVQNIISDEIVLRKPNLDDVRLRLIHAEKDQHEKGLDR